MNPIADLKADGLRTLFIYIVPGAIALLPWLCLFVHEVQGTVGYADKHQALAAVVLVILCLSVGKLLDGLGTYWEVDVNDARLAKDPAFPNFSEDWSRYIRTAFVHEPVAVEYIQNLTQTLKFEINAGVGFAFFALGQLPLKFVLTHFSVYHVTGFAIGGLGASAFAFWSSYGTSRVLALVRKWLTEGVLLRGQEGGTEEAG
jgi:hypothetical protein